MSISTEKSIAQVTYNGVSIPLAQADVPVNSDIVHIPTVTTGTMELFDAKKGDGVLLIPGKPAELTLPGRFYIGALLVDPPLTDTNGWLSGKVLYASWNNALSGSTYSSGNSIYCGIRSSVILPCIHNGKWCLHGTSIEKKQGGIAITTSGISITAIRIPGAYA